MKKFVWIFRAIILLVIVFGVALYTQRVQIQDLLSELSAPELPEEKSYQEVQGTGEIEEIKEIHEEPDEPQVPKDNENLLFEEKKSTTSSGSFGPSGSSDSSFVSVSLNLAVPFTSQAPYANWDEVHEETCEEASLLMVHEYYQGTSGVIAPDEAEAALQEIIRREMELFGFYKDTNAVETALLIKSLYGYTRVDVVSDPTVDDLKALIAAGHPVIVPAAGRQLGNPNFSGIGPIYHMLVLRGYTETQFITNDPGTRRGDAYVYDIETIMNAMHDWNGGDVEHGAKVVVVVYPN